MLLLTAVAQIGVGALLPFVVSGGLQSQQLCPSAIQAVMVDKMDSANAVPGQVFRFRTRGSRVINHVVVRDSTYGYGLVRYVSAASKDNHDGVLALEPRYLLLGKNHYQVTMDPHEPAQWSPRETMVESGIGFLPIPGLARSVANRLRTGRNITLGPGFTFAIVPIGDLTKAHAC